MTANLASKITGYVLAGGRSTRMGQDKVFLPLDGQPLVELALQKLRPVCSGIRLLSGPPKPRRDALLSCYAPLVPDADPTYAGPLAALAAALQDCPTKYALLLAADQPDISPEILAQLAEHASADHVSAACYRVQGKLEPLPLLAARDLLSGVQNAIETGERRLLLGVQTAAANLGRDLLQIAVPALSASLFTNLNRPEEYRQWRNGTSASNHSTAGASEIRNG